jgi:hypothetical protein
MRIAVFMLMIVVSIPMAAIDGENVVYEGGTAAGLISQTAGRLETAGPGSMAFVYVSGKLLIDFEGIQSYEYSEEVAHHLGVLPMIAVGLVRARKRNHFIRITYRNAEDTQEVAVFRIPKHMSDTLLPVLQVRAPQASHPCIPSVYPMCLPK